VTSPDTVEVKLDGVERPVPGSVFGDAFYAWITEALGRGIRPTVLRTASGEMPDGRRILGWCETDPGGVYLVTLDLETLKVTAEGLGGPASGETDDAG